MGDGEISRPLRGQVALITGASRGIGRATALALAAAGADCALGFGASRGACDAVAAEAVELGVRTLCLDADISDSEAAAQLIPRVLAEFGRIDIVINNAGITRDNLALRMSKDEWDSVMRIDLDAAFHICKAALRAMLKQRSGRVVNVSSISGIMGNAGQANYSAAKAGLIGLTKSLAREVGSRGITVNAVAPGFIETEMTGDLPGSAREAALAAIPLGRLGTAEEVASVIRFLCLPEAAYVTGAVFQVDGGLGA